MNRTDMIYIKESRENTIGFLHYSEQVEIQNIMSDGFTTNKKGYWALCDDVLSAYDEKWISNKKASKVFEILMSANDCVRLESHRV